MKNIQFILLGSLLFLSGCYAYTFSYTYKDPNSGQEYNCSGKASSRHEIYMQQEDCMEKYENRGYKLIYQQQDFR